jgi:hypothetical protein
LVEFFRELHTVEFFTFRQNDIKRKKYSTNRSDATPKERCAFRPTEIQRNGLQQRALQLREVVGSIGHSTSQPSPLSIQTIGESRAAVVWPSSRAMAAPTPLTGIEYFFRLARAFLSLVCSPQKPSTAARPSASEKGVQGTPKAMAIQLARTPEMAKLSAAARPSAAEKGVR